MAAAPFSQEFLAKLWHEMQAVDMKEKQAKFGGNSLPIETERVGTIQYERR